jgi:hypothetical protein
MDWLLSVLVLVGNWGLGKKYKWAWTILALNSLLWVVYALRLDPIQWGLIPSAVVNLFLCVKGAYEWRKA